MHRPIGKTLAREAMCVATTSSTLATVNSSSTSSTTAYVTSTATSATATTAMGGALSGSKVLLAPKKKKVLTNPDTTHTSESGTLSKKVEVATTATSPRTKRAVVNHVTIGDVRLPIYEEEHPERVPRGLPAAAHKFFSLKSRETLGYMRWIAQKELLGQDICIIGDPGPAKRWLSMMYAQVARREVQLLTLSRDTTEADIKQRKEVQNGTLLYVNQAAVTAALEGQILVIDGLERAERNVLPVINNLLENREMHLDNGTMLIHPQRYDDLCKEHGTKDLTSLGLLRVSEHFRVIGLTVPTPRFAGNPLDPPLRSRFQCLFLHSVLAFGGGDSDTWASSVDHSALSRASVSLVPKSIRDSTAGETMVRFRASQNAVDGAASDRDRARAMPGITDLEHYLWATQAAAFPGENLGDILQRVYPWQLYTKMGNKSELTKKFADCKAVLKKFGLLPSSVTAPEGKGLKVPVTQLSAGALPFTATATLADGTSIPNVTCGVFGPDSYHPAFTSSFSGSLAASSSRAHLTGTHIQLLQEMAQSHICGRHIAVSGLAGGGKTAAVVREFATMFGYPVEVHHLYADMSTRDLLQRRSTDPKDGSTTWELSPMMEAARDGKLAVLDGIDQLPPGSLAVLQELLLDGSISLFDGSVYKNPAAFEELKQELLGSEMDEAACDAELASRRIFKIHPAFRLIVTCRYPEADTSTKKTWLTSDIVPLFNWHILPELQATQTLEVLKNVTLRYATSHSDSEALNLSAPGYSRQDLLERQSSRAFTSVITQLVSLQSSLDEGRKMDPKVPRLSLRQLIHIAQHALFFPNDLQGTIESALLVPLMNQLLAEQVRAIMVAEGLVTDVVSSSPTSKQSGAASRLKNTLSSIMGIGGSQPSSATSSSASKMSETSAPFSISRPAADINDNDAITTLSSPLSVVSYSNKVLSVSRGYTMEERALIPHVPNFHPNVRQRQLQAWLAKNIASKNSILLVGNQGVGKNKVVDQFLAETGLPRHYLQLHRDTTVSSLTISPSVVGGKVTWEDSPLVKAAQLGHVLVVDEIDKAPVEVVHILKGLIEDREMKLGDGRKISGWHDGEDSDARIIKMHPDFRIIVLANPPGFPFHGNDFYRECGDLFACYVMQNPDAASQEDLLKKVGPDVPPIVLKRLVQAFGELSSMFKQGTLSYPFSLRELIAVVKHLQAFPQDGLLQAVNNVFNFDLLDANTMSHVRTILHEKFANIQDRDLMTAMKPLKVAHELQLGKLENMGTFMIHASSTPSGGAKKAPSLDVSVELASGNNEDSTGNITVTSSMMPVFGVANKLGSSAASEFQSEVVGATDLQAFFDVEMALAPSPKGGDVTIKMVKQLADTEVSHAVDLYTVGSGPSSSASLGGIGGLTASSGTPLSIVVTSNSTVWVVFAQRGGGASSSESDLLVGVRVALPTSDDGQLLEVVEVLGASEQLAETLDLHTRSEIAASSGEDFIHLVVKNQGSTSSSRILSISLADIVASHANNSGTAAVLEYTGFVSTIASSLGSVGGGHLDTTGFAPFGCLSMVHTSVPTISILYAGKRINATFSHPSSPNSKVTVLRANQFAPQLYFVCVAVTDTSNKSNTYEFGILKIVAFHNAVIGKFNQIILADIPPKNPDKKDARVRYTVAEMTRLFMTETTLVGYGRGEGGVPSTSADLAAEDLQDALFVMNATSKNGSTVRKGEVLYALADARQLEQFDNNHSETSTLGPIVVTLTGYVNTASEPMQLVSMGASAGNGGDVVASSAWSKVGSTSSKHGGGGGISGASVSADYAHHQLVAGGHSAGSSVIHAISTHKGTVRHFPAAASNTSSTSADAISVSGNGGIGVAVDSSSKTLSTFDTNAERIKEVHERWSNVLKGRAGGLGQPYRGGDDVDDEDPMSMSYSKPRKPPSADNLKRGEEDPDNDPHVGGNNWAGGSGGTDTAGLGGLVGPYRLDKGHPISQVDPAEKKKVPQHIIDEARKMGKEALEKRLSEINMSPGEDARYRGCYERVQGPIQQLRTILQGLKVRETERGWVRHQTDGIWDDNKLVEGITGEKTVYKRRVDMEDDSPLNRNNKDSSDDDHKKRLLFVLDVSASMYRFNSMDGRLNRLVECAIMIMESFKGFEDKIDYSIVGHSGDSDELPLIDFGKPPTNKKERMSVCMKMVAYSQFCWSGDNTVSAMRKSVRTVKERKAESHFVFVVSDANLAQYGIHPSDLSNIIRSDPSVHMYCIFIASFGAQARSIQKHLPSGHGFECLQTDELPIVLKQIFTATDVLT